MEQTSFSISVLQETYQGIYVTDEETAVSLIDQLSKKDCLFGLDTETCPYPQYTSYPKAALSPLLSRIRLIQVFDGKNSIVFDLNHLDFNLFISFLSEKRFVAHNALFDLQYFLKAGVKKMNLGCTLLLARLIMHAQRPTDISLSLEALTENVLGVDATKKMGSSDWSSSDLTFEQVEYAALDPIYALLVGESLAPGLSKYKLEKIYKLYKESLLPVAHMQLNGIGLDRKAHEENIEKWREEIYNAKEKVLDYTGLEKLTPMSLAGWLEENLSEEDLKVWPVSPTDKLKTDAHTFADFSHVEIASLYGEFQKKEKLLTSFGDNLLRFINPETKRIHAHYNICGARTGRMSCSSPNLQQLPRDQVVRNIFIPDVQGEVFVCADFSQIELRCAAEISKDKTMLKAYEDGVDLHSLTASVISHKKLDEVTKDDRQRAKAFNFGLLFGLGHKKFSHYARMSYGVEISEDEAKRSIEIWRELYGGYREWQFEHSKECERSLVAYTVCGKRQRLTEDNYYGTGLNHPVQGTAAEILLHALIRFQKNPIGKLVNTVHDEITIQVREENASKCKGYLEGCMIEGYLDVFPNGITYKLVEAKIGNSWGAVK